MANKYLKQKTMTLMEQRNDLIHFAPSATCCVNRNKLTWIGTLQPTCLSLKYSIKIVYSLEKNPKCFVLEPKLALGYNKKLPHVYNQKTQQLCLFYQKHKEWNASMSLAETIVPWASEWLFFYELWLVTGEWQGGGVHPSPKLKNK